MYTSANDTVCAPNEHDKKTAGCVMCELLRFSKPNKPDLYSVKKEISHGELGCYWCNELLCISIFHWRFASLHNFLQYIFENKNMPQEYN